MIEREKVGNNDTLNAIFEDLYNLLSEANRIPLTDKIIVEESDISGILEDLREAIPREVRNAGKVLEDQHNIVTAAQEEASAIVEKAKTEAKHIVTAAKEEAERILRQETVVQQAEALAKDIKTNAMRHSDQVRADADAYSDQLRQDSLKYADEMLAYLEKTLQGNLESAVGALRENRGNIRAEQEKLEEIIQDRTRNMPASLEEGRETDEEALEDGAEERDE